LISNGIVPAACVNHRRESGSRRNRFFPGGVLARILSRDRCSVLRRTRALLLVVFVAVFTLPGAACARPGGKLVPATGAYLGAYTEGGTTGFTNLEGLVGRKLKIDHHYQGWTSTWPSSRDSWDVANGRLPMVSWSYSGAGLLSGITSGKYDSLLRTRARAVKAFGNSIFIRWGWEMNGDWFTWSGSQNNSAGKTDGPSKFVAAWKRMHDIFVAEGATNAVWVWCPARVSNPNVSWNSTGNYYPGDSYVDWACTDIFNWGTSQSWSRWTSFSDLFRPFYSSWGSRKPILLAEVGSAEKGGSKQAWIDAARSALKQSFPSVAAVVWFNSIASGESPSTSTAVDWRVNSSSGALTAFRSLGADAYFRAGL
jgi:Glycosyl hydrolase family 26